MVLDLDIVKSFKAEKNSTAQYSFRTSDRSGGTLLMVHAIYSGGLSLYIYPWDYVSQENA